MVTTDYNQALKEINQNSIASTYVPIIKEYYEEKNKKQKENNIFNIVKYIHKIRKRPLTHMTLQRLLYYCQVWSIVWTEKPIFNEKITTGKYGLPTIDEVYSVYKDDLYIEKAKGKITDLTIKQKLIINKVVDHYGNKTAHWLSDNIKLEMKDFINKEKLDLIRSDLISLRIELDIKHSVHKEEFILSDLYNYYNKLI